MWTPKRVLVIGAHTDDYELGAGGTIARFIEDGATVCGFSASYCAGKEPEGYPAGCLIEESKHAGHTLGIGYSYVLVGAYPVELFDRYRQSILEDLIDLRCSFLPDLVLTHCSSDFHQDHTVIHQECVRAFKHCTVLGYRMPWNMRASREDFFMCLSEAQIDTKIRALNCYKSQQARAYMNPLQLRHRAELTGMLVVSDYAESFETINVVMR